MSEKSGNQKTPEQKDAEVHTLKRPKIVMVPGFGLGDLTAQRVCVGWENDSPAEDSSCKSRLNKSG